MRLLLVTLVLLLSLPAFAHSVDLTWNPVGAMLSSQVTYSVKRSSVSNGPRIVLAAGLIGTSYTDKNLGPNVFGCYVVTATDTQLVESDESDEVCVTTLKDKTPKVLGVKGNPK